MPWTCTPPTPPVGARSTSFARRRAAATCGCTANNKPDRSTHSGPERLPAPGLFLVVWANFAPSQNRWWHAKGPTNIQTDVRMSGYSSGGRPMDRGRGDCAADGHYPLVVHRGTADSDMGVHGSEPCG